MKARIFFGFLGIAIMGMGFLLGYPTTALLESGTWYLALVGFFLAVAVMVVVVFGIVIAMIGVVDL